MAPKPELEPVRRPPRLEQFHWGAGAIGAIVLAVVAVLTFAYAIGKQSPPPSSEPGTAASIDLPPPSPTPSASASPIAASSSRCQDPPTLIWDNHNQGHNGYDRTTLTLTLPACETLLVTSGHAFGLNQAECGYKADQLCVVIVRLTNGGPVTVTGLDAANTWYGITKGSIGQALEDKRPQFFAPPNCGTLGCAVATVYAYSDGQAEPAQTMSP